MDPYWIFLRYSVRNPIFTDFGWFLSPARRCTGKKFQYLDISSLEQKYISSTDACAKMHSGPVYFQKKFQWLHIRSEKKKLEHVIVATKIQILQNASKSSTDACPAISRFCILPAQISGGQFASILEIKTGK